MRRSFVAGNWKMNLNRDESVSLAQTLVDADCKTECEMGICVPDVYIDAVRNVVTGSPIGLGAQNVYHEANGAYTGETSVSMLQDLGVKYVIIGHSERRNILGESNDDVNRKLVSALKGGLIPIVCVGELLAQREAGQTLDVVKEQFQGSFQGISGDQMRTCVVAYEPVWAIGTGKVATPDQAEEVHADLRRIIADAFDDTVSNAVRIQYGGSVKPDNAAELMAKPNIDGALVGGAALQADSFLAIVAATE